MTDLKPDRNNPDAPFGRDDEGRPLAPLGHKIDGKPRMDRRGAGPGQRGTGNSSPRRPKRSTLRPGLKASTSSLTDLQRKSLLIDMAANLLVTPLASLSRAPFLEKYMGARQTDALAGDAMILNAYAPHLADAAILLSKTKPKTLAWMDKVEDNAPYVMLAQVGIQLVKAVADNHMRPNPHVAEAGRNLAAMRIAEMAEEINRQAAAMRPDPAPAGPEDHTQEIPVAA
jgi:hypothetical protein